MRPKKKILPKEHWHNLTRFHSDEINALLARFNQVECLLGLSHHSVSEGYHCEILLRDYLRRMLPNTYSVDTGFVRGNPVDISRDDSLVASPQIDILIHDSSNYSPIYKMGDLVVVMPESVHAVIEVKKRLTAKGLKEAFDNIYQTKIILKKHRTEDERKVFYGILAFSSVNIRDSTYKKRFRELVRKTKNLAYFPNIIGVLDSSVMDFGYESSIAKMQVTKINTLTEIVDKNTKLNIALQYIMSKLMTTIGMLESKVRVTRFSVPKEKEILFSLKIPMPKQNIKY